jgi:hypothetical protein
MTTFLFDLSWVKPLTDLRIPLKIFIDRARGEKGKTITESDDLNVNFIKVGKFGDVRYGVFHSKLIIYKFDDRIRIIISSANLCKEDWTVIS